MNVYLDNAATAGLSDSMKKYLISVLDTDGNPSSLHSKGIKAKRLVAEARRSAAKFINADPHDIYFTCGGAAANTLAVRGYCLKHRCTVLYSPVSHKSVLKCVESCKDAYPLKVNHEGFIDLQDLEKRLAACDTAPFVVIDHASSELGTIQNVKAITKLAKSYNGTVYLDCTGSIPQLPVDVKALNTDMLGFSAHKLGGLKGCGILYIKKDITLEPLIYGSQEQGLVGGTENVLGIASAGKAAEAYNYSFISSIQSSMSSASLSGRDYVYNYIAKNIPGAYLVGASIGSGNRLPLNLYMCFKGVEGESLMLLLDMNGIQVSTGSACDSRSMAASSALSAIGMNKRDIHSCIRMTFSGRETKQELDYVCEKLKSCVEDLRELSTL